MDNQFSNQTKIIIITSYFLIVIITEILYREPLKNLSTKFIEFLQDKLNNTVTRIFFSLITYFGSEKILIPIVVIFLFFNPLIYFYYLIFSIITSTYFASILKLIYTDFRPFWDDNKISPIINCDMGYGNPSGHSLVSTVTYLGLWKLLQKNRINKKRMNSLTILSIMIVIIFLIMFSRIFGGVHNLNQILFGFLLGFGMFFTYFNLYKFYNKEPEMFFIFIEENKIILNIIFISLYLISIPIYFIVNDTKYRNQYYEQIKLKCGSDKIPPEHKQFSNEGFKGTSLMIALIGILNGLLYSKYKMKIKFPQKEYIIMNDWHNLDYKNKINQFLIMGLFCLPGLIFLLIPSCFHISIIMLFKYNISFLIIGFCFFGPGMYFGFLKIFKDEDKNIENIEKVINTSVGGFSTDD